MVGCMLSGNSTNGAMFISRLSRTQGIEEEKARDSVLCIRRFLCFLAAKPDVKGDSVQPERMVRALKAYSITEVGAQQFNLSSNPR
jgi:hypothetical protein